MAMAITKFNDNYKNQWQWQKINFNIKYKNSNSLLIFAR